jgi:hypothetical protein
MSFELILPFLRPIEALLLDEDVSEIMGNPDSSCGLASAMEDCARNRTFPSMPPDCAPASKSSPIISAKGSTKTILDYRRSFRTEAALPRGFHRL